MNSSETGLQIEFTLDTTIYSREAILKASHTFSGQLFVELRTISENQIGVHLTTKDQSACWPAIKGEFINRTMDFTLREKLAQQTEGVRNLILAHALSKTDLLNIEPAPASSQECSKDRSE